LTLIGCWFYVVSNLVGGGMHLDSKPGFGMLVAVLAILLMLGAYLLIRSQNGHRVVSALINVTLSLGVTSLIYGIILWVFELLDRAQRSGLEFLRPGEIAFRLGYGALSLVAFILFNYYIRKADPATTEL
jgi:drug/metabolite transporter (DMT)-like permease